MMPAAQTTTDDRSFRVSDDGREPLDADWQRNVGHGVVALMLVGGPLLYFVTTTAAAVLAAVLYDDCLACSTYSSAQSSDYLSDAGILQFVRVLSLSSFIGVGIPAVISTVAGLLIAFAERRHRWAKLPMVIGWTSVALVLVQVVFLAETISWVIDALD